jgi:hypothetical protein
MTTHFSARTVFLAGLTAILLPLSASATQMTFEPRNPIFQPGNFSNTAAFAAIAEATKKKDTEASPTGSAAGSATSLASTLQASVLANAASEINRRIFCTGGGTCQNAGTFQLGNGGTISFVRDGSGNITINFNDPINGTTTIIVPSA